MVALSHKHRLFKKLAKITQKQKNIEYAHVNKAQTLICPIKHALKKQTKAFNIKITCKLGYHNVEVWVAFPADFSIKLSLPVFAHQWIDYT